MVNRVELPGRTIKNMKAKMSSANVSVMSPRIKFFIIDLYFGIEMGIYSLWARIRRIKVKSHGAHCIRMNMREKLVAIVTKPTRTIIV